MAAVLALATSLTEIGGAGCDQAQRFESSNTMECRAMLAMMQLDVCIPAVTQALVKKSKELPGAGSFPHGGGAHGESCWGRRARGAKTAMVVDGFQ